ncbi:MAG TPA: FadD3 family acyl-CoA ligase [Steroidobacteraceae bacterium]|nr:FadD3 family acyl-CoA ligase [Steroidobacteraceae bacterium]
MPAEAAATVPRVLAHAAQHFADAWAVRDGTSALTFSQLHAQAQSASAAFLAAGIAPGERIGIWAPNSAAWIVAALGALGTGAVLVPLNTRLKGKEAAYILRRSGARLLLTVGEFLGTHYPQLLAQERLPALELLLLLDAPAAAPGGASLPWPAFLERGRDVAAAAVAAAAARVAATDVADILFTSGTTGEPKGVLSTHRQNVEVFRTWSEVVGLRSGDRYLGVNPFFHSFGYKAGWLACLLQGATMYPLAVFDAARALDAIERERITVLPGPPTLYQSLLAHESLPRRDLSSLRLAVTGAASVPPALITRMRRELHFKSVLTAYGLTESTGVVTICPHDADDETVATRCGVPIPGVEVRCVDASGRDAPTGAPGEVLVRGYNVMRGYFEDAAATQAAIDAHGWLHTGDVGVLDERGYLRITDRIKDVFIVGGFNCYPAEIERLLAEHPAVAQAAVIGVPDERLGEVGKAFIVLRPGAQLDGSALIAWARENMANYKVPRYVDIVAQLPLNAAGKVQKYALREGHAR